MRRAAVLASIFMGASMSGARAVDVAIKSQLSQSIEANDNYQLATPSPGMTYPSVSTLTLDTIARTPTMLFTGSANLSYRTYFGNGAEALVPGVDKGARASIEKKIDNQTTFNLESSWQVRDAATIQREETGTSTVGGDVVTTTINGGFKRQLNSVDTITWSARATSLTSPPSGNSSSSATASAPPVTSSTDVSTTGAWIHQVNSTTKLTPSVLFDSINYQNSTNTQIMIWKGMLGLDTQLTKRLTFKGSAGGTVIKLTQDVSGNPLGSFNPTPFPTGTAASATAAAWVADLLVTYKLGHNDNFSLAAAQTVGPDTLGTIRKTDIAGVVLSHAINHWSNLSLSTDFSRQLSSSSTVDLYSASASYDHRLAQDWHMALTYRFRHRISDATSLNSTSSTSANSNSILLVVRRDVTILPAATGSAPIPAPDSSTALMASSAIWAMTGRFANNSY